MRLFCRRLIQVWCENRSLCVESAASLIVTAIPALSVALLREGDLSAIRARMPVQARRQSGLKARRKATTPMMMI